LGYYFQAFAIRYFYLAHGKLYYNSFSDFVGQIIFAVLIFTWFVRSPSVPLLVVANLLQSLASSVILIYPYAKRQRIEIDLNLRRVWKTFVTASKLGVSTQLEAITSSSILLLLGIYSTPTSVGIYSVAFKVYSVLLTIIQGVSYTLMPALFKNLQDLGDKVKAHKINLIFHIYVTLGLVLGFSTYIMAPAAITVILGASYVTAVPVLRAFSLTLCLWPNGNVPGASYGFVQELQLRVDNQLRIRRAFCGYFNLAGKAHGALGAALALPGVACGTIVTSLYFLFRLSRAWNFSMLGIFSVHGAIESAKALVLRAKP